MRWTEQQLADYQARVGLGAQRRVVDTPPRPSNDAGAFALGRLPSGTMNKTEARYAAHLAELQHLGEVRWFKFEGVKLRLADNTFYTPDFAVLRSDCAFELHEIKGYWQDDARVKVKVCASIYPFRFIAVTARKGGGWSVEEFP